MKHITPRSTPESEAATKSKVVILTDGSTVNIRLIGPYDEPLMIAFHKTLSNYSVYMRYFDLIGLPQRISHARLSGICNQEQDGAMVFVAVNINLNTGLDQIIAVARLSKQLDCSQAEFAVIVSDNYQGLGLGKSLIQYLSQVGKQLDLAVLTGDVLRSNYPMVHICNLFGFNLELCEESGVLKAKKILA